MNEILALLRQEARLSDAEIAKRLGKTEDDVRQAIQTMEDDKVVLGYQAIVNPDKVDEETVIGIIEVRINPQRETGFDAIAKRIYLYPEVKLCFLVSGRYDLLVLVEGRTLQDVSLFISKKLSPIDHVVSTTTHFILKKYKEFGVVLDEPEDSERLPITP
jgi:DNA-binding Lrp family transcriptional regulator